MNSASPGISAGAYWGWHGELSDSGDDVPLPPADLFKSPGTPTSPARTAGAKQAASSGSRPASQAPRSEGPQRRRPGPRLPPKRHSVRGKRLRPVFLFWCFFSGVFPVVFLLVLIVGVFGCFCCSVFALMALVFLLWLVCPGVSSLVFLFWYWFSSVFSLVCFSRVFSAALFF